MKILSLMFLMVNITQVFSAKWRTHDHKLFKNDKQFLLKGTNWFGYENSCNIVNGLWVHPMTWYLDFLKSNNFNGLRIPFSYEIAMNLDTPPACLGDEGFQTVRDSLNFLLNAANDRGIEVMFDFHTIHNNINAYPLDSITTHEFNLAWGNIIELGLQHENFMAIDVKNEPHGKTDLQTWAQISNDFISFVKENYKTFDGLFFVEGIQGDSDVWGGSFKGTYSGLFNVDDRFIFSPHVYGPSVIGPNGKNYDEAYFNEQFGFLLTMYDNAIVIGETGGYMNTVDGDLQFFDRLSNYLKKIGQESLFWWCLNSNGGDTGGLLDDWNIPVDIKLNWLKKLIPNPTNVVRNLRGLKK